MNQPTPFEVDKALAERITRKKTKTSGGLLTLDYESHGTASKFKEPGTLWRASVRPRPGDPPRVFLIFTPCPGNSRNTAKALLGRHLRKEILGVRLASVEEIAGGELKARSQA
jgi:hypothetical protein